MTGLKRSAIMRSKVLDIVRMLAIAGERSDSMNPQFKKGVLELCVLALLARKDCYGFELVSRVSRSVVMSEGTVYPLMKRLRDEGLLNTYLKESSEGPPRKYYRLTDNGRAKYASLLAEWRAFTQGVDDIIEGRQSA